MTNTEYEAACVTAAKCYDRFEGEHRLKQYDEMIAQVEKTLARLQEERRELVNRLMTHNKTSPVLYSRQGRSRHDRGY